MFTRKGKFDGQIVNFNKTSRLNQVFFLSLLTKYRRNKRETRFLKLASPSSPPPSPPSPPIIIVIEKILATIEKIIDRDKNRKTPPLPPPLSFYFSTRFFFLHVRIMTRHRGNDNVLGISCHANKYPVYLWKRSVLKAVHT